MGFKVAYCVYDGDNDAEVENVVGRSAFYSDVTCPGEDRGRPTVVYCSTLGSDVKIKPGDIVANVCDRVVVVRGVCRRG